MIYVDDLREYPVERLGVRLLRHGRTWCHLTTDGDLVELWSFAAQLGLPLAAFQSRSRHPHYDLTPELRQQALTLGAVSISTRDQVRLCLPSRRNVPERLEGLI